MRDDTVEVCRQLAKQCSDASAVEVLVKLVFDVFFGSDGKLTVNTQKVSVLQVCVCVDMVRSNNCFSCFCLNK